MNEGFWAIILNPGGRSWDPAVTPLIEGIASETPDSHEKVFVAVEIGNNGEVFAFLPGRSVLEYRNDSGAMRMASMGRAVRVLPPGIFDRDATPEEILGWVNE